MKRLICATLLLGFFSFAHARELSAQDDDGGGIGGILEWIHKLSGPGFIGAGISPFYEFNEQEIRFRLTVVLRKSIFESKAGLSDSDNITMLTIQPSVEFAVGGDGGAAGVGVAAHRFGGDVNPFWHWSFPITAQWRRRSDDVWVPRAGGVVNLFPPFGDTDFTPLQRVNVEREGLEFVLQAFGGVDYRIR